ncbi:MAG: ABC transporter permease [Chloroflexota bacterium]|nr:ABC transporter permease [Chloroflexota bacterium]
MLLVLLLVALCVPILPLPGPFDQNLAGAFAPPFTSTAAPLGRDDLGRNELSRLLFGLQPTLFISLVGGALATLLGLALGLLAGYGPRWTRVPAEAAVDVLLTFPTFVLAIALVSIGGRNVASLISAVALTSAGSVGRLVRSETLRLAGMEFITAMVVDGARLGRILVRGLVPSLIGLIIVQFSIVVSVSILTVAALGFIGLGIAPPAPELGTLVNEGAQFLLSDGWLVVFSGLLISILILALNFIGDGLRDLLDPRLATYAER